MKVQVAGIVKESCQNGYGLRNVIFFSGCNKNCPGCHNKDMQNMNYGDSLDTEDVLNILLDDSLDLIDGITVSGGEPFLQPEALMEIVTTVKEKVDKTVWVYSGYTLGELKELSKDNRIISEILNNIDVLVDGPYVADMPSNERYKGSGNQVINYLSEGREK